MLCGFVPRTSCASPPTNGCSTHSHHSIEDLQNHVSLLRQAKDCSVPCYVYRCDNFILQHKTRENAASGRCCSRMKPGETIARGTFFAFQSPSAPPGRSPPAVCCADELLSNTNECPKSLRNATVALIVLAFQEEKLSRVGRAGISWMKWLRGPAPAPEPPSALLFELPLNIIHKYQAAGPWSSQQPLSISCGSTRGDWSSAEAEAPGGKMRQTFRKLDSGDVV